MRGTSKGLSPFDTYRIITAIARHFSSGYDCIKYNFKMKSLTPSNFGKRRDQYFFERLSKQFTDILELKRYAVANCLVGNVFVKDMTMQPYDDLTKKLQSFRYLFMSDLKKLHKEDPNFDNWLISSLNFSPKIISKQLSNDINIETVIVIDALTEFLDREKGNINDPLIWDSAYPLYKNYRPFVCSWLNVKNYKQIVIDVFTNE